MKIIELIEQTIGTTGSSAGQVGTVQPVSNRPSDRPAASTSQQPNQTNKIDPKNQQLANLLKQNQINVKSTDDFLRAFDAVQQNKKVDTLPPEQQKAIADYTKATINKPGIPTQMNALMKSIMQAKPKTPTA